MYDTHIFLDFEMNPIPREFKEERSLCHAEICEIGAVKLDANYNPVSSYTQLVKPHYAPISPHITKLTGITDEAVANAPDFEQAIEDLQSGSARAAPASGASGWNNTAPPTQYRPKKEHRRYVSRKNESSDVQL